MVLKSIIGDNILAFQQKIQETYSSNVMYQIIRYVYTWGTQIRSDLTQPKSVSLS